MRDFIVFLILVQLTSSEFLCDVKLSTGKKCGTSDNSTIKYYFDRELSFCYPYLFLGCAEGENSFTNEQECLSTCKPVDQVVCGANSEPVGTCMGFKNEVCKTGSVCVNGAMIGLCCDEKIQAEWNSEQSPQCLNTSEKVVEVKTWFGSTSLIGRDCAHKFCPKGSTCVQGKWTAHCCTKK